MTENELREQVRRRNGLNRALGVFLVFASAVAWWVSYWVVRAVAWIILRGIDSILETRWDLGRLSFYIALGFMGLLVWEGVYQMRSAAGVRDYFHVHHGWFGSRPVGSIARDRLAGTSYMASHCLFLAPEATLQAVALLRHRLPDDEQTIRAASAILDKLARTRDWHPVDPGDASAVGVLHALKLIWTREKAGLAEIRIPPA